VVFLAGMINELECCKNVVGRWRGNRVSDAAGTKQRAIAPWRA
jgi:hypothetical protein